MSEVSDLKDENEARTVLKNIEQNFNHIFTSSEEYSPNFIACLVEIAIKHAANIRLDASAVGMACLNSLQQSFGIVLLEEYLALNENGRPRSSSDDDDDEGQQTSRPPATKRMRMSETAEGETSVAVATASSATSSAYNDEAVIWIELAKLYRSMNDYDSIKGIFAGSAKRKNIVTEFTKNGLEFESNNDYYKVKYEYKQNNSI